MPTDQKVTGLSPVGVTKRERQMLFPLLFTAACNLQAVFSHLVFCGFHGEIGNLFKPMRKPKNPDEHGHRDDRKMQFFRFTRPKPDNRTKFSNSIFQQPARFAVKSRRSTRFLGIFGIVTTLLFVGKGTRTGRPFGFASIRLFRIFAYNTLRKTGLSQ